jgi:DNA-binding PadR family transcriptional regulator
MVADHLGEFEQVVLLSVFRLGDRAYGVPIREEIERRASRKVTIGALYATLNRLEEKGYLRSWFADPTPRRGGRSKRYLELLPSGTQALASYKAMLDRMWSGVRLKGVPNV